MCGANPERTATGDYAITGTVTIDGSTRAGVYVRVLDKAGDFVAESPTSQAGRFTFFAAPGEWRLRLILDTGSIDRSVVVTDRSGAVVEFNL